jgi:hypothetical protein
MTCSVAALACLGQEDGNGTERDGGMVGRAEWGIEGVDARDQVGSGTDWIPLRQGDAAATLRFRGMVEVPCWEGQRNRTWRNSVDHFTGAESLGGGLLGSYD